MVARRVTGRDVVWPGAPASVAASLAVRPGNHRVRPGPGEDLLYRLSAGLCRRDCPADPAATACGPLLASVTAPALPSDNRYPSGLISQPHGRSVYSQLKALSQMWGHR